MNREMQIVRRRSLTYLALVLLIGLLVPPMAQPQPPQKQQPLWKARLSYHRQMKGRGGGQNQHFEAEYEVGADQYGQPSLLNGKVSYADNGNFQEEYRDELSGAVETGQSQWSVSNVVTFRSPEELGALASWGGGVGSYPLPPSVYLPGIVTQTVGERRFVSGESHIYFTLRVFYPGAVKWARGRATGKEDLEVGMGAFAEDESQREQREKRSEARAKEMEKQSEGNWPRMERLLKDPRKHQEELQRVMGQLTSEAEVSAQLEMMGMRELRPGESVITGSRNWTETSPDDTTKVTHTFAWHFTRGPADVEAVIIPAEGYEKWLPEGCKFAKGCNEDTPGNALDVMVVLQRPGQPGKKPDRTARFKFELTDVSKEKGVALNWPPKDQAKDTFDLKIDKKENPHLKEVAKDGQSAESKGGLQEAHLTITSHDWGAYGKLKVTAILDDGQQIVAHLEKKPDKKELVIPLDENDNHIADAWEKDTVGFSKDSPPESDDDLVPVGDNTRGDGLSLYEEYRGFFVLVDGEARHVRTDPRKKTLFIVSQVPHAKPGIARFGGASGLEVYLVGPNQVYKDPAVSPPASLACWPPRTVNPYVISFNHGWGHPPVDQHALWLKQTRIKYAGQSCIGPPKYVDMVEINKGYWKEEPGDFASVVAHELGHAVGMPHHGKGDYDCDTNDDCRRKFGGRKGRTVAVQHGTFSGGDECIMRYTSAWYIERIEHGRRKYYDYYYPDGKQDPDPTQFCRRDKGTGVNDPSRRPWPKAGDATIGCGNNLGYIRISDRNESRISELEGYGCLD